MHQTPLRPLPNPADANHRPAPGHYFPSVNTSLPVSVTATVCS